MGGSHYKLGGEEHWDRIWRLFGPGYFVGNITKNVERYKYKNGLEDLRKARHFLDKLIELEEADKVVAPKPMKFIEPGQPTQNYVDQDNNRPLTLRGDTKFP